MSDKETVEVTIDVHEPSEIIMAVDNHDEVEDYHLDQLPAADIEIAGVGFERKTIEDYASSLMDGRLDDQTNKLDERYEKAFVLLDGDLVETESPFKSAITGESLRGHMASLTARENSGVQGVVPCSNPALLADMAIRLARKCIEDSDREQFIPEPIEGTDVPVAVQMYACLPGVGPKTAKALAEEYPRVGNLVKDATYEDLQEIDGIGKERALQIIDGLA